MNYYKIKFEDSNTTYERYKTAVSYLSDDQFVLLAIHEHNLDSSLETISEVYRMDQINSAGEIDEIKIYPNKELEQSLLTKKQKHWH